MESPKCKLENKNEAFIQYEKDREGFNKKAKEWTTLYAQ